MFEKVQGATSLRRECTQAGMRGTLKLRRPGGVRVCMGVILQFCTAGERCCASTAAICISSEFPASQRVSAGVIVSVRLFVGEPTKTEQLDKNQ